MYSHVALLGLILGLILGPITLNRALERIYEVDKRGCDPIPSASGDHLESLCEDVTRLGFRHKSIEKGVKMSNL